MHMNRRQNSIGNSSRQSFLKDIALEEEDEIINVCLELNYNI